MYILYIYFYVYQNALVNHLMITFLIQNSLCGITKRKHKFKKVIFYKISNIKIKPDFDFRCQIHRNKVLDSFSLVRATAKSKGNLITITFKSDEERAIKKGRAKTLQEAI